MNSPMGFGDVYPNMFNNLDLGIDAENCDLAVYNCNFYNINDDLNPTVLKGITGTAVSSVGIKTLQPATTTTIGGNFIDPLTNPVTLMPNNFIDCKRGVFISEINATVAYNHFLRNTYTGIAFKNGTIYQYMADSNDFINCNRGIAAREMGNSTVLITRNYYNFDNNYVPAGGPLKFDLIAFSINNAVKGRVAGYMQGNNYCKGFKTCFALTNVDGYPIAFNNPIIMDMNGPGSPYGIRVLGGDNNRLYNNKIQFNGSNSTTSAAWRGISIETSTNTLIFSNTMQKLGTGLRFFNCNAQQYVQCNNFDACYRGVELNSSYIGIQGHNKQPNSLPSGNQWQNQPSGFYDVQGIGSYVSSTWYVMSSTPPDAPTLQNPPIGNVMTPAPFAVVTGTPQQLNCNPPAVNDDAHVERILIVIQQTGYFNQLSGEAKYSAVAQAYVELDANRTLMERGTLSDEILKLFYDSISQTDIGRLLEVNQQIQNNDTATASAINQYVSGHYSQDENAALVNETYIRHLNDDAFMLNEYETSLMENIAYQNPMEGGSAVYGAMVLLDLNLNHDFNGYTLRQIQTTKPIEETYFTVYPNPASDKIVVLRKQFTEGANQVLVSNTIGEVINNDTFEASQGMHLINTSNWQKGIYFIQITNDSQAVFNFKVVIIK